MKQQEYREELRELAAPQSPQIEQTQSGKMFITHRRHRIFFNWHPEHNQWFFIVHCTLKDNITGYPTVGGDWFTSWSSWVDGITWGKQTIDKDIAFWEQITGSQKK